MNNENAITVGYFESVGDNLSKILEAVEVGELQIYQIHTSPTYLEADMTVRTSGPIGFPSSVYSPRPHNLIFMRGAPRSLCN